MSANPRCIPVMLDSVPEGLELAAVRYSLAASPDDRRAGDLLVDLIGDDGVPVSLVFVSPVGFRVLDERDLLEFWNTCSTPQG